MAATDDRAPRRIAGSLSAAAAALLGAASGVDAAVLPDERADAMYHHYKGGGMDISGPSLLVRKNFRDRVSVVANHYVDSVTSASIDVMTTASPYTEERTEMRLGVDYLHDKTTLGVSWVTSEESDYVATTAGFSVSQDFFGDLSTLTFGYAQGNNEVGRNNDPSFAEESETHSFRLGFSQVLSRRAVVGLGLEVNADRGYLNNPYRSVRYLDPGNPLLYSYQSERYPGTRTGTALALRTAYHLPGPDALKFTWRVYSDTWGIAAQNVELAYSRDLTPYWRIDARARTYSQDHADFYSDLFPYQDAQNHLARDKELSTFDTQQFGLGVAYVLKAPETSRWKQMTFNLQVDRMHFGYDDFRDLTVTAAPGSEPLYEFDATVTRLYYSLWY
ncbi:MAG: DUF3570 domain-containing protein [Pseudomonadota bacterium]